MFEGPFPLSENNSEPKKDEVRRQLNYWTKVGAIAAAGMKVLTSVMEGGNLTDTDIEDINQEGRKVETRPVSKEDKKPEIYQHIGSFDKNAKTEDEKTKD